MVTTKEIFDDVTNIAVVVIPVILSYQAQITGMIPEDQTAVIMMVTIIFGILNAYSAKLRRDALTVDVAEGA